MTTETRFSPVTQAWIDLINGSAYDCYRNISIDQTKIIIASIADGSMEKGLPLLKDTQLILISKYLLAVQHWITEVSPYKTK